MKVLFASLLPEENDFHFKVARHLQEQSIDCYFVSLSRKAHLNMKKKGAVSYYMHDLLNRVGEISCDIEEVRKIEDDFDLINLRQLYLSDRYITGDERDKTLKTLQYIYSWDGLLKTDKPDCIVTDVGGEVIRRTVYHAAKKHCIPTVFLNWVPLPGNLSLSMDEFYHVEGIKISDNGLSPEDIGIVENHIKSIINRVRPFDFNPPLSISMNRIKKFLKDSYISVAVERGKNEHFLKKKHAMLFLKRKINHLLNNSLFSKPNFEDKYFFLPLHGWDDFQLTVRARHCLDQKYIVRLCAEAIPYGYKLYVKEHPGFVGYACRSLLREISMMENVVLLSPTISPYELIRNSQAVITINSTAGYEALLFLKPVITLGYSFYRGFGLTIDVDNFFDLPRAIKSALTFKPNKKRLYKFISAAMKRTCTGEPSWQNSDENAFNVANALFLKIKKIGTV